MSRIVRKPDCCEADQRLYFRYIDSTIPFLSFTENFQSLAIPTIALKKSRQTFDCTANTRVVPKVPLHSLFCHNSSKSELTTLMITKYYIYGLWGQIFVLLRAFVKIQGRFEPLFPYFSGAGLMTLPLILIFS